jgi:hypothetical protein
MDQENCHDQHVFITETNQKAGVKMRNTAQKIRAVDATMAMESMPLTDEDRIRLRDIFDGKVSVENTVRELIKKHSKKECVVNERV